MPIISGWNHLMNKKSGHSGNLPTNPCLVKVNSLRRLEKPHYRKTHANRSISKMKPKMIYHILQKNLLIIERYKFAQNLKLSIFQLFPFLRFLAKTCDAILQI